MVWVCGYRCGALTCGWMSTTQAWWPKSVGMLVAEATLIGVLMAVAALGGGGEAENGGCEPASDDGGKSELVHCGAFFFCVLLCSSRGAKSRFRGCVGW